MGEARNTAPESNGAATGGKGLVDVDWKMQGNTKRNAPEQRLHDAEVVERFERLVRLWMQEDRKPTVTGLITKQGLTHSQPMGVEMEEEGSGVSYWVSCIVTKNLPGTPAQKINCFSRLGGPCRW